MTLEEMQDAKAYPLRYTIKHPGMTPAEMARREVKAMRSTWGEGMSVGPAKAVPRVQVASEILVALQEVEADVSTLAARTGRGRGDINRAIKKLIAFGQVRMVRPMMGRRSGGRIGPVYALVECE